MPPDESWTDAPRPPFAALPEEIKRLVRAYLSMAGSELPGAGEAPLGATPEPSSDWAPALDVFETPSEYGLWVDLPGVDPSSIELALTGRTLEIHGERPAPAAPESARLGRSERRFGRFARRIELPGDVESESIVAESRHGVLHVRLPKAATQRPRTIPVRPS